MSHNVDLKELARSLYARRGTGIIVPYERRVTPGWTPSAQYCHINVDRFVLENADHKAVRGWVIFNMIGRFMAHSVIEDVNNNRLFDITPLHPLASSQRYPFIRHDGPEGEFEALIDAGIENIDL